jgi:hypothetical protein
VLLICGKCKTYKEEEEFYKANGRYPKRNGRAHLCKPCKIQVTTEYAQKNYEHWQHYRRENRRKNKYYWPNGRFDEVLKTQNYACAICGIKKSDEKYEFHADHDHTTNAPRGVLCRNCNIALGNFRDNPEILRAAVEYLERWHNVLRK